MLTELPVCEWSFPVSQGSGGQCVSGVSRHIPDHFSQPSTNIYINISVQTNTSQAAIDILSEVRCISKKFAYTPIKKTDSTNGVGLVYSGCFVSLW